MNTRNIVFPGFAAGVLLLLLLFGLNVGMNRLIAYDIAQFSGMRPMDNPVMLLFFVYPLVVAFAAAYVFDIVHPCLPGSGNAKGMSSGILLLVIKANRQILPCTRQWTGRSSSMSATRSGQ